MNEEFKVKDRVVSVTEIELPGTDKTISAGIEGTITKMLTEKERVTGDYVVEFDNGSTLPVRQGEIGAVVPVVDKPKVAVDPLGKDIDETPSTLVDVVDPETAEVSQREKAAEEEITDAEVVPVSPEMKRKSSARKWRRIAALEEQVKELSQKIEMLGDLLEEQAKAAEASPQKEPTGNGKPVISGGRIGVDVADSLEKIAALLNKGWQVHTVELPSGIGGLHIRAFMIGPEDGKEAAGIPVRKVDLGKLSPADIPAEVREVFEFEPSEAMLQLSVEQVLAATSGMRPMERVAALNSYEDGRRCQRWEARRG